MYWLGDDMNIRRPLTIGGVVYPPVLIFRGALMAKINPSQNRQAETGERQSAEAEEMISDLMPTHLLSRRSTRWRGSLLRQHATGVGSGRSGAELARLFHRQ